MTIDLWADVACPWCFIGERRLRRALEEAGVEAEVRWRPFQLQPDLPRGGLPWEDFVERKFGGWERARPMFAHVARAGEEEGIRFDFERVASAPNTAAAHGLILEASRDGRLWEAADAVYRAYFTEGRDVGDPSVLHEIAAGLGVSWPGGDPEIEDEVRQARAEAARLGVNGVPFIVFDGRLALSGAQPVEQFRNVIRQASAAA